MKYISKNEIFLIINFKLIYILKEIGTISLV